VATRKAQKPTAITAGKRTGKPLTVYLADDLSSALSAASKKRMVHKSVIVRVAVERLLNDLEAGQLQLPLGI
jgi:predicted DNA-binding protein